MYALAGGKQLILNSAGPGARGTGNGHACPALCACEVEDRTTATGRADCRERDA